MSKLKLRTVYQAINKVNEKSYIGQTSANFEQYKAEHIENALCGGTKYFYNAIRKHSQENFEWRILYQKKCTKDHINYAEKFFIAYYDTFGNNGYNLTPGGEGGNTLGKHPRKKEIFRKRAITAANTMRNDIDENGLNAYQRTCIKRNITMKNDIDENGLNAIERRLLKMLKTKRNDIDENGLNTFKRVAKNRVSAMRNDIDENGLNAFERTVVKIKNNIDKNGLNSYQRASRKHQEKMRTEIDEETGLTKHELRLLKSSNTAKLNGKNRGKNNHWAKKYLLIDPNGKEYFVHGEIWTFCKEHNLSCYTLKQNIDKGIIRTMRYNSGNRFIKSRNCIGWTIKKK